MKCSLYIRFGDFPLTWRVHKIVVYIFHKQFPLLFILAYCSDSRGVNLYSLSTTFVISQNCMTSMIMNHAKRYSSVITISIPGSLWKLVSIILFGFKTLPDIDFHLFIVPPMFSIVRLFFLLEWCIFYSSISTWVYWIWFTLTRNSFF